MRLIYNVISIRQHHKKYAQNKPLWLEQILIWVMWEMCSKFHSKQRKKENNPKKRILRLCYVLCAMHCIHILSQNIANLCWNVAYLHKIDYISIFVWFTNISVYWHCRNWFKLSNMYYYVSSFNCCFCLTVFKKTEINTICK